MLEVIDHGFQKRKFFHYICWLLLLIQIIIQSSKIWEEKEAYKRKDKMDVFNIESRR